MYALVNGVDVPIWGGKIAIEDRGLVFADALYEVFGVDGGHLVDMSFHLERLVKGLSALSIAIPMPVTALEIRIKEFVARHRLTNALVYLQISRGAMPRNHAWKDASPLSNWFLWFQPIQPAGKLATIGVRSEEDPRWRRVDIKTVNLLPNCLSRQNAWKDGFDDVWFHDVNGFFREATSANIWIVKGNQIFSPPLDGRILAGTVRRVLSEVLSKDKKLNFSEKNFDLAEVLDADEAFQTGTGVRVASVVRVNNTLVGSGKAGPVTRRLASKYNELCAKGYL